MRRDCHGADLSRSIAIGGRDSPHAIRAWSTDTRYRRSPGVPPQPRMVRGWRLGWATPVTVAETSDRCRQCTSGWPESSRPRTPRRHGSDVLAAGIGTADWEPPSPRWGSGPVERVVGNMGLEVPRELRGCRPGGRAAGAGNPGPDSGAEAARPSPTVATFTDTKEYGRPSSNAAREDCEAGT